MTLAKLKTLLVNDPPAPTITPLPIDGKSVKYNLKGLNVEKIVLKLKHDGKEETITITAENGKIKADKDETFFGKSAFTGKIIETLQIDLTNTGASIVEIKCKQL